MPSVSDPGQALVEAAREADVPVEVIPGPSACVTALVSSVFPASISSSRLLGRKHGDRVRRLQRLPSSRRAHLLRVSTSHRRDARGRGRGLSPARCCRLPRAHQTARESCVDPPPS
ncbi:MAG: SAM-dependent methyltransferase [Collinsella sp.]